MGLNYTITHNDAIWESSSPLSAINLSNGNITDTITTAGTRVLSCAGKYMPNDLIIGAKTLNCAGKIMAGDVVITAASGDPLEGFTYTGSYNANYVYNSAGDKCIALLGNGTLTLANSGNIDVFLVGGGGGGCYGLNKSTWTAGSRGGTTSAFGYSAAGGYGGYASYSTGCGYSDGGSGAGVYGGNGGSNGGNGGSRKPASPVQYPAGQGTTTRAFGESNGNLFAGGGGGFYRYGTTIYTPYGVGGADGGGNAGYQSGGTAGTPNTGGGGGGFYLTFAGTSNTRGADGGGGGYTTTTKNVALNKGTAYSIIIGAGGTSGGRAGGSGIVLLRASAQ